MVKRTDFDFDNRWATAHEENSTQPIIERKMDLFNNEVGRSIELMNPKDSDTQLANLVYKLLIQGKLRYIKNGNLVPTAKPLF